MFHCMEILQQLKEKNMEQLTFLWEEPHAKVSQLVDLEKGLKTQEEISVLDLFNLLKELNPNMSYGKMSEESLQVTKGKTSNVSSHRWQNGGMVCRGEFLTLNTLEYPNEEEESLLLDVLETTSEVQPKYYLSQKACVGILKRAKKRGKTIPNNLEKALKFMAQQLPTPSVQETTKE